MPTDTVTLQDIYDIKGTGNTPISFNVADFTFIGDGIWGNGSSLYGNFTVTAENINFYNKDLQTSAGSINLNAGHVTFNGSLQNGENTSGLNFNLAQLPHIGGTHQLTFGTHKAGVTSYAKLNTLTVTYGIGSKLGNGGSSYVILDVNTDSDLTLSKITNITSNYTAAAPVITDTRVYTTTVNIAGGKLKLGTYEFKYLNDDVTINHSSGVLAALNSSNVLKFSRGSLDGSLKYVIGENAIFDTSVNNIEIDNTVVLSASGAKGGFTVKGGKSLVLGCAVNAVNGDVVLADSSVLSSAWTASAQSVNIGAGSIFAVEGDIALASSSNIALNIFSETSFGKISSTGSVSGDDYGLLQFVVDSSAFDSDSSISISLNEIITASGVDWEKFDISSNYAYQINGDNIVFSVPEPSQWAAIFGVFVLALAIWRKRK